MHSPAQSSTARTMNATTGPPASSAARQPASSADGARAGQSETIRVDDGLSAFLSVRPRLFGIAYRMLNSKAAAEDIVQDVWVRWQTADRGRVRNAAAFLVTTARRLAINVMQSARARRETYIGPWLQPVDTGADPRLGAERRQALSFGVLLLLEKLTPTERAAYILREAFDYPYREIANVLRLAEANARQVVTRARERVANGGRMSANPTELRRLLDALVAAAQSGDVDGLENALWVECSGGPFLSRRRASAKAVDRRGSRVVWDELQEQVADGVPVRRRSQSTQRYGSWPRPCASVTDDGAHRSFAREDRSAVLRRSHGRLRGRTLDVQPVGVRVQEVSAAAASRGVDSRPRAQSIEARSRALSATREASSEEKT
jgi:RNA polymerase sigma factor (sigma-70 family)